MIEERALIHPSAKIGNNVSIGAFTVIGPDVEIGDDTSIGPHVVINGPTRIGKNNKIYQFSSFEEPQDKKYGGEDTLLEIGDNNTIREFCTLNRGTTQGGDITRIGNNNLLMAYVHIAHDCIVGDHTVFANNASLSGHVIIEDHVTLSGFSAVHQFCTVGQYSFVAGATYVRQNVLPYLLVSGYDASTCGLNKVGLQRHGFAKETIEQLRRAYKLIFRSGLMSNEAIAKLHEMLPSCPEVKSFIDALENAQRSQRGIVR